MTAFPDASNQPALVMDRPGVLVATVIVAGSTNATGVGVAVVRILWITVSAAEAEGDI